MRQIELSHERGKIIRRLIAVQFFGAAVLITAASITLGSLSISAAAPGFVAIVFFLVLYICFTALILHKLTRPLYLKIDEDGSVYWTPLFSTRLIKYGSTDSWELEGRKIVFKTEEKGLRPAVIPIPATVII